MSTQEHTGPPDYRIVGRHGVFPATDHDETERYNFLAHLNRHLAEGVMPGVAQAYAERVEPAFVSRKGCLPSDRHEVRKALCEDSMFQTWSALRRNTMEMRQQAGRSIVLGQLDALMERSKPLIREGQLQLKDDFEMPRHLTAVDHHCMPGSYYQELLPNDISSAANYDSGMFVTTGGALGRFTDGGGHGVVRYVRRNFANFVPQRILDIGCGLGHNVLPIAEAFPKAQVIAVDAAAPMLRYGAARATSMGVKNITFVQADVAELREYPDASFDWIQSTMFLHETSYKALKRIMRETRRLIAPGGLVLHIEQPTYSKEMPLFEQAMRDWDAFYNNEPFWTKLHEISLDEYMVEAGFKADELIHGKVTAVVDQDLFPSSEDDEVEDFGRKPAWEITGARVAA